MKRVVVALLILVACGTAKHTTTYPQKCVDSGYVWRYSHTRHWTTQEPVYGLKYDFTDGEYHYGITGWETEDHYEDVYTCQVRK